MKALLSLVASWLLVLTSPVYLAIADPISANSSVHFDLQRRESNAVEAVKDWISSQPNVNFADGIPGGWERWTQVDYATNLLRSNIQASFRVMPWAQPAQQGVDIDINRLFLIDLRVYNYADNPAERRPIDNYLFSLRNNVNKFVSTKVDRKYAGYQAWVIGIASGYGILNALRDKYNDRPGVVVRPDNFLFLFQRLYQDFQHDFVVKPGSKQQLGFVVTYRQVPLNLA